MTKNQNPATVIGADIRDIQYGKRHHHHWHYVYKRRRKGFDTISSRQITAGQFIALSGSLIAGLILELNKDHIAVFAGALLLLPGIIDLAASITGAMCAKINHQLDKNPNSLKVLKNSVLFSILLTVFSSTIVGLTGGIIGELFFESTFWKIMVLCQLAMLIVGLIAYPAMALVTYLVKKTSLDPDNIVGPVETGLTDALMVLTVSILIKVIA